MFYKVMFIILLSCIYSQASFAQNSLLHSNTVNISAVFQPTYIQTVEITVPTSGESAIISLNIIQHSKNVEAGDYKCTKSICNIVFH